MPWDEDAAAGNTKKAKSPKSKKQWAEVANSVKQRGGSDVSAIKQANAVVARRGVTHRPQGRGR